LRYGETYGSDTSRSAALRSFLIGALNANWNFQQVVNAVFDRVNVGGRKVQGLADLHGMARAMKYLRGEYKRAAEFVRRNLCVRDRNGALLSVVEWTERVDGAVWRGASGLTNRNALYAMADMARRTGSATRVPMSVRTLAEMIGCSPSTASAALRRLVAAGWLALKARSDGTNPTLYALTVPSEAARTSPHTPYEGELSDSLHTPPTHDVWRQHGLGKGAQRIFDVISQKKSGAAEIASLFNITPRAVYQHLRKLREAGLAESTDGVWSATDKNLDDVARELGTAGTGLAQRRRHAQQRDAYHRARRARSS
jgi:DNA-binding MarR family transcriptional regulator